LLEVAIAQPEMASAWLRTHTYAGRFVTMPNAVKWPLPDSEPAISPAAI
jgi:hypothetical protein